ncbi:uncharacterized protein LOC116292758 [Actinia tenebrosa]|uniref:Uncharacterized protein LOC116292758 n=1 Tax=Actinia tenebrosa TaxID=6105 RepID=A0A6P8HTF7_ACTTE|nr:uncharacterized protein LOC116292758 [Actinia tenebrosa]
MTFLREVYQSCSFRSLPELTRELCEKQCDSAASNNICAKIWMPLQCKSEETRFYFDIASTQCKEIKYKGCLGNQNLFPTSTSCQQNCAGGAGNYGPTVVTPTIASNAPPVPTSYYWYFLAVKGNQITGSPPLLISGTYKLIDLGYLFNSKQSWVQTRITRQDCLLNPEACLTGLSIGFKIKLDKSIASCQEPRYLLDTGATSLMTRGVSVFVVGETLSVQISTSKNVYKAVTQVTLGRWFYLMITWKPSAGLSVYINENKKASTVNPLAANNPPINDQNPNFAVGRGLGSAGGTCGTFYVSSLAIFKQYVDTNMVIRIYRFFWVNIVSPTPPTTYYIYMRVTNKVGQRIIVRSGDDMPAQGFPISANVIAEITKTVPGNIETTFTVYNMDTGKQMAINQSESITITPTATKQYPYAITVSKPGRTIHLVNFNCWSNTNLNACSYIVVVGKRYFIFMRITNMAKRDVRVLTGDGQPAEGFTIKPNLIADITKQVTSPFAVNMSVVDTTGKPLFINYKPYLFLTPTQTKGNAIPLTITLTASPVRHYYIQLAFKNYAGNDVIVRTSDLEPEGGFHVKKNTMMKITKTVGSKNPITLTAIDKQSRVAVAINNAPSFIVTPKNDKGAFTEVQMRKQSKSSGILVTAAHLDKKYFSRSFSVVKSNPTGVYTINLVVTNNAGRDVSLIPSDNKPDDGFEIPTGTMVIVSKTTNGTTPVDFIAVDIETETVMRIDGEERKRIIPSTNESRIPISITAPAGSQQKPKLPSVTPAFYWSFYTVNNGTIPGSPSFKTHGDFQIVDGGLFLDGTSAYLTAHLNSDDALVYPERFSRGFAFGLKVKFPDTVKGYTVPKYVVDTGAKSLSSRGVSLYILEQKLVVELATSDTKWKAETDIATNKWIYILVSWSMQRGLTIYVDGQEMSGDSGGMGVTNLMAAPQEENLSIGRNIGDSAPNFASFYISSLAIFREDLSAPLAFDIYKYYITDAIIQPSKMYYINFHVTNTLGKEIDLLSSDGQPAGGFHIKPKQVVVIRKELSSPTSVTFTAQDVSTAGDVLINGELEYIATPSEYKQQMTAVTITPVGSSGKPAPRDRFYVTLNLKNKYRSNAIIISSDNHPSDGYRLSPMSYETLTKEVFSEKKIIVHAYDPATNKELLINGESSYSVKPTRERGNPDALEITSSEKEDLMENPPVPYSYYWSLSSINKGFVEGNPAFKVTGGVKAEDGGLVFDGKTGWLGAHVDKMDCLVDPERCTKGFAIGTKINIDPSSLSSKEEKYIIDTGAKSTAKRGVSLYTIDGKLVFVLATTDQTWEASTSVTGGQWMYLLITWNRNEGVKMYVDNQMKSSTRNGKPNPDKQPTTKQINLNVGRNVNGLSAPMNGMFKMASLVVFNTYIPTQMIAPISNYFSKPLATRPSSKYYIVLEVTNPTTNSLILKTSDNYPNQGFPIKAKVIAKIKKEVSTPAQVSFQARAAGTKKVLFLDGKSRIDITPSGSPLDVVKITVSEQGQTVKPLPKGGITEETGVSAPPVRPVHSWLLANLDGNAVPGNPALTAKGKFTRIDGGLGFDGSTTFLSGSLDNKDCMINPDVCSEGFSFGIKLKFISNSLTVNAPRYVVDSGRTAKGRGIAVYLVMKSLFVEIATSNALYKGAVTVTGDSWFYLTATWSRRTGLTLYIDDKPYSTVPSGMSGVVYPIYTGTPNFVIGRSATAASYYSKVNIGSFSTYNQLLSSNDVKANYRFFWIRGSGGEGKTFYAVLEVTNPLQTDAVILTDDGVPNEGFRVRKRSKVKIAKTMKSGLFITFRATDIKGLVTYYLDNVDAIKVQATHSKDVVTRATLSLTGVDTETGVDISTTKYSKAPPVLASHSWSMNAISLKASTVPGIPPLSAVGALDLGDGGLLFDGKSTWLGATISQEDCLIDPGKCISGFTLASKLFLHNSVASYTTPKYIVDTGASSAKTRGISMYVMSGKVFFELATSSKVWTVSAPVDVNAWLFISTTWSNDNGLLLYLNGVKKVEDKTGRLDSGRTMNLHDKNLCVGRDSKEGGADYAQFMMASLLTFNSYLSPLVMRATYTFYWRNAGAGLAPVGFVALKLVNKAGVDAIIDTSDKKPGQGLPLPTGYLMTYHKQIAAGSFITIKATEASTKSPLLLNNQPSVSVTEALTDRVPFAIVVSKTQVRGGGGTSTQIFYISIKILNKSGKDVLLKASDSKAFEERQVKKGFQTTITKSVKGNAPITFTVIDPVTQTSFLINGKKELTITPTAQKGTAITFEVTNGKKPVAGKQYYIALKVINRSGKNVQLTSSSGNWDVKKNVMMNILKGTTSNSPVEIYAVGKEDKKPVTINGKPSFSITPELTKERVELTLRSTAVGAKKESIPSKALKPSVYYVTLKVFNKAGKKSIIAPSFKDISQGLHIGSAPVMQITKEYTADHPLRLQAFDPLTGKVMLMNNKQHLIIRPGSFDDPATKITLTNPTGTEKPEVKEHYITILANNRLNREARIIPSKGKKGGYLVPSKSMIKVLMIIKGGPSNPTPINFKVQDVETESTLEINEKITPISVTPSELSDVVTQFNITAPAPSVKPQHSWSMLALKANKIFGSPPLHAHGFYRYVDDGIAFDGTDTYMTSVLPKYDSLVNPDNSKTGFTVATKLRFDSEAMEYQDQPRFILDTGGHHKGKRGMSMYIDSGKLYVEVETLDRIWTVSKPLNPKVWMYLTITWNKKDGLKLYRDSILRADDDVGRPADKSTIIDLEENLTVGRSVSSNGDIRYAKFDMGSLTTFGQALNQSDIDKAFIFFSNSLSAKIFYAPIRITNEAGRDIIVKPSKGNTHGFNMIPRSTLEVTLMSMSTDGTPVSPVLFTATDAATKTPLEINNSPNAFPVTPRESMNDFTTMVVAVPQPSVVPKVMWTLQKVEHGTVVGSSPIVQAHGQLKQIDDGLELNGKDSWLDAGDFKGTCLSDPQLCPAGLTVGFKVKFDDDSLAYTHEPHYVLDNGGSNSNGRGFTVFIKNEKLYAVVSQSNSAWRVEAPYTTNKWQYVLITWKQEDGLTLYMDGAPVASSEAVVPQRGDHLQDSLTRLAVGRNSAGPPYGNTKMALSSLVFFDHHVRTLDAKKISLYYWGSVSQSSSNRFIKVKFFNRAGVPIKIIPSKGDNKDQGYTIQPHMNLQLSYLEKGPFNNVPVTFLALNPATNERLFINGRSGVLRTLPIPSKTAVTEAVISSSFACPQSNGFFSDPTSNARYIHCTNKSPNIMTCPDKMTWHSDIDSCAGEGRESSDLYYYNVRFNNYAGNEAEIIKTTGNKQRNMLPPGKSLHVKFTTTKKHPSVFRAIYADSGESLRLNDYPLLQIYPSDNPEKVTEVNVNKPAFFYTIITKTGSQESADTQANVFIKLIGEDGSTPELPLAHKGVTHFKLGGQDKFRIEATNIGNLQKVFLRHDDSGESPNWFLEKVLVRDMKGKPYEFNVNSWLDSKQGDHVTAKLLDVQNPLAGSDQCVPSCLNNATCIDGKCQCGLGYEGDQCQDAICEVPCLNGGTCISPDSNKCACPEGYTGSYCDKPVCSDYCRNGGTCSGPNQCTCPTGFVGSKCEISSCIPKCLNGGQCVDGSCQCPLGHSGKYCEQVSICDLSSDPGPCFHELYRAASRFARLNRTTGCKRYLTDVLQSCTANNGSYNMEECSRICGPEGEQSVCKKIWQPGKCSSLLTKYTYDKDTGTCRSMLYNGCLGNSNSFDSLEDCNNTCGIQRKRRTITNSTREQKPNLLRNLLPKRLHHVRRHASYK